MIKRTPFKTIETERLILKPHKVTFEYAVMVYNIIKENKAFLTRFLDNLLKAKSPEDEYAFFIECEKEWKNMEAPTYGIWTKKEGDFIGQMPIIRVNWQIMSHQQQISYVQKHA